MKFSRIIEGIFCLLLFLFFLYNSMVNKSFNPGYIAFLLILLILGILCLRDGIKNGKKDLSTDQRSKAKPVIAPSNNDKKDHSTNQLSKVKPVISPTQNEENLEKYKQEIEDYGKFRAQVYLCASNSAIGNNVHYVCIHKETKELFEFSAKKVGHNGAFDQYCFAKQPQKITTFPQLLGCLNSDAKVFFSDLSETNWEEYFAFMFLSPDHNGETLRKQLLSRDSHIVRNAVFAVHNLVLKTPKERKDFLADAYQNLSLIKQNLGRLDMGGIFASGNRFNNRAIQIIEGNNTNKCFCRLLIDEFGPSANGLTKQGFLLIQEDKDIDKYSMHGIIECPVCKKRYSIIEKYTGWHIPTYIYCSEIPNTDLQQTEN